MSKPFNKEAGKAKAKKLADSHPQTARRLEDFIDSVDEGDLTAMASDPEARFLAEAASAAEEEGEGPTPLPSLKGGTNMQDHHSHARLKAHSLIAKIGLFAPEELRFRLAPLVQKGALAEINGDVESSKNIIREGFGYIHQLDGSEASPFRANGDDFDELSQLTNFLGLSPAQVGALGVATNGYASNIIPG